MTNMIPSSLKNWPILHFLNPEIISTLHMVFVFGDIGNTAIIVNKKKEVYIAIKDIFCQYRVDSLCGLNIKTFACGTGPYVVALTESGQVYGLGSDYDCINPTRICQEITEPIIQIACGFYHCLALTSSGRIFTWNRNPSQPQLYRNATMIEATKPHGNNKTTYAIKFVYISCGNAHNMAITIDGKVFSWGNNDAGQLGRIIEDSKIQSLSVVNLDGTTIRKVVCGSQHTMALSDDGVVYVWGDNKFGQLGISIKPSTSEPNKLEVPKMGSVVDIAASYCNDISAAITANNQIYVWGHCLGQIVQEPLLTQLEYLHDAFACFSYKKSMHEPIFACNEAERNLLHDFEVAFDDPNTSDFIIKVCGKPIHVHKVIMSMRSHYFRTMFQDHWLENSQVVIEDQLFSYESYSAFLKYLYTGKINLPLDKLLELLCLADMYIETQLQVLCAIALEKEIEVKNVILLYEVASKYNCEELQESCIRFALKHMTAVVQTTHFAKLNDTMTKTFIARVTREGAFKT